MNTVYIQMAAHCLIAFVYVHLIVLASKNLQELTASSKLNKIKYLRLQKKTLRQEKYFLAPR